MVGTKQPRIARGEAAYFTPETVDKIADATPTDGGIGTTGVVVAIVVIILVALSAAAWLLTAPPKRVDDTRSSRPSRHERSLTELARGEPLPVLPTSR